MLTKERTAPSTTGLAARTRGTPKNPNCSETSGSRAEPGDPRGPPERCAPRRTRTPQPRPSLPIPPQSSSGWCRPAGGGRGEPPPSGPSFPSPPRLHGRSALPAGLRRAMEQHLRRLRQELVRARGKGWGWGGTPSCAPPPSVLGGERRPGLCGQPSARGSCLNRGEGKQTNKPPPPQVSAKIGDQRSVCGGLRQESGAGWRRCEGSVSPCSAGAAPGVLGALPAARGGTAGTPHHPHKHTPGGDKRRGRGTAPAGRGALGCEQPPQAEHFAGR